MRNNKSPQNNKISSYFDEQEKQYYESGAAETYSNL